MKFLENKFIIIILRLVIGGLFIYASWGKLMNPEDFGRAIRGYDILPLGSISFLSVLLPFVEFISGLFLILGIFKRGSSFIIIAMLLAFLIGLTQAYTRGLSIDCGCFSLSASSENTQGGYYLLVRIIQDVLMMVAAIVIYNFERKNLNSIISN
ncbi:MAG TPA: MauE/DoxX family redox-associated membrane protein [Ignavibacteria bacterium]